MGEFMIARGAKIRMLPDKTTGGTLVFMLTLGHGEPLIK